MHKVLSIYLQESTSYYISQFKLYETVSEHQLNRRCKPGNTIRVRPNYTRRPYIITIVISEESLSSNPIMTCMIVRRSSGEKFIYPIL